MTWLDSLLSKDLGALVPDGDSLFLGMSERRKEFDPILRALCAGLPYEYAQDLREERAAILEYDAGMSREDAERLAGVSVFETHIRAAS